MKEKNGKDRFEQDEKEFNFELIFMMIAALWNAYIYLSLVSRAPMRPAATRRFIYNK